MDKRHTQWKWGADAISYFSHFLGCQEITRIFMDEIGRVVSVGDGITHVIERDSTWRNGSNKV